MAPAPLRREVGEVVDPEELRAGDVLAEIGIMPSLDAGEVVAAVDEPHTSDFHVLT